MEQHSGTKVTTRILCVISPIYICIPTVESLTATGQELIQQILVGFKFYMLTITIRSTNQHLQAYPAPPPPPPRPFLYISFWGVGGGVLPHLDQSQTNVQTVC